MTTIAIRTSDPTQSTGRPRHFIRRPSDPAQSTGKTKRLLRRIGAAGFAFFLIKGLLWLLVPAAVWLLRG